MLDDLDRNLLALLGEDGRTNNRELGDKLGVSEGTVRNRIRKLEENGVLKVAGMVNPDSIPEKELVILGIKIASSRDLVAKTEEITALDGVLASYITTGRYDIIIEVWADAKFGLIKFLSEELTKVDGVVSTESFLVMKNCRKWIQGFSLD